MIGASTIEIDELAIDIRRNLGENLENRDRQRVSHNNKISVKYLPWRPGELGIRLDGTSEL